MKAPKLLLALACAAALLLPTVHARVFQFLGGAGDSILIHPQEPGWSRAYRAEASINGARADIEVWGTAQSVDEIGNALRDRIARAGGAAWLGGGAGGGWGLACVDQHVVRFLVTPAAGRYAHVFMIRQTFDDWRASRAAPRHQLRAAPPHPGSAPGVHLADTSGGLELQFATVAATPEDVRRFYRERLAADGWTAQRAGAGLDLHARGGAILLVQAESAGLAAETRLMLAHQRGPRGLME